MTPLHAWLQLTHATGIGPQTCQKLLRHFGDAETVVGASDAELAASGLSATRIAALRAVTRDQYQADLDWLTQADEHHLIPFNSESYPPQLRQLPDAPALLYVRGDPDYLQQPQLAMVGSRTPTAGGRRTASEFARFLSQAGLTITSGLALGIDGASHEGALQGLAGTIAVVGHGLDIVYPAQHTRLAQAIAGQGAIVSDIPVGALPARGAFPRRNRLISGLSLGVLVVEAALGSGSLITARLASEQGREVFAIPGSIHNPLARGCHHLIRQGAKLVETAQDILEELSGRLSTPVCPAPEGDENKNIDNESAQALDPDHQKLLKCLAYEPASIDELVQCSGFSAAEVASMLLILELEGRVTSQDGRFSRSA